MPPYRDAFPITPSDSTVLARGIRALSVAVAGNVAVVFHGNAEGTAVTIALAQGVTPVGDIKKVMATNTTATGITALT